MNDPHVVALIYQIEHGRSVDYSKAKLLDHGAAEFRIKVKDSSVHFEFKDHYATKEAAREVLEDYIREWEFVAGLRRGPNCFKLKFDRAEIMDRKPTPTPGVVNISGTIRSGVPTFSARATIMLRSYPPPPSGIKITPDVQTMWDRYMGYRQGREPLASMAYFCLDTLEDPEGKRAAADKYQISSNVLKKIRRLSSTRGGQQARKASGMVRDLTNQEHRFLEEAIKALIYRVAETAHNPNSDLRKISLSDISTA